MTRCIRERRAASPSTPTATAKTSVADPPVLDVRTTAEWLRWLRKNHESAKDGVWLRLFKKDESDATLTYVDAVETALCFGWIDGQAKKHDDVSRVQRFTPRRSRSQWSK